MDTLSTPGEPFSTISFYVVAHADDWQLFMQPNAYKDLTNFGTKVVFIITTAGDAGTDEMYWAAREEGSKSSIRFCLAPLSAIVESSGKRELHARGISYWSANNATCYFLRLPDGNLGGEGFPKNSHQSLSGFRAGRVDAIAAVDNSSSYKDWSDLSSTMQAIIEFESKEIPEPSINYLNPDLNQNPNDHADHIATGQALEEMPIISNLKQALFVGYSVDTVHGELAPTDLFWKAGMLAAYEKAVFDNSGYSTLKESVATYLKWCLCSSRFIIKSPIISPIHKAT
ncbi:MAG: PIG-L family deacetylase [Segetibacter sp.]